MISIPWGSGALLTDCGCTSVASTTLSLSTAEFWGGNPWENPWENPGRCGWRKPLEKPQTLIENHWKTIRKPLDNHWKTLFIARKMIQLQIYT